MKKDVPLMIEIRAETWRDGWGVSFRQKLKPIVNIGSRGCVRGLRLAYELIALAHAVSTSWMQ